METGTTAPSFTLLSDTEESLSLSDYKGKKVILFFYPRDNTPGCTKEVCAFRDSYSEILETGTVILGVSPDTTEKHRKFKKDFDLPFPLLADTERQVLKDYEAWGEKKSFGKISLGVKRSTVIIDEDGLILKHYKSVKPAEHAVQILDYLKTL